MGEHGFAGTKKRKIMHKIQYKIVTNVHFNSNLITMFFFLHCRNGRRLIYQNVKKWKEQEKLELFTSFSARASVRIIWLALHWMKKNNHILVSRCLYYTNVWNKLNYTSWRQMQNELILAVFFKWCLSTQHPNDRAHEKKDV